MADAPSPSPGAKTTDISPAQGDELVRNLEVARAGVRGKGETGEIAADDAGATAAAEQMNKPKPPPIG